MDIDILEQIKKKVPDFVWLGLNEDYSTDAIIKIRNGCSLSQDDVDVMTDVIGNTVLKKISLEDIESEIEKKLSLDEIVAKEIALIILREIFFPIKDFFPGLEDEILKLGGEIPKEAPKKMNEQLLKREEEMEEMAEAEEKKEEQKMADAIIEKPIAELLAEHPKTGEQIIGNQKAIEIKSMPIPMKPLVKYWLEDYRAKMGFGAHSNIDRAQYVYHDKNTRSMNEEERRQLNLILKSADEGIPLPYSTKMGKIDFSKINEEN